MRQSLGFLGLVSKAFRQLKRLPIAAAIDRRIASDIVTNSQNGRGRGAALIDRLRASGDIPLSTARIMALTRGSRVRATNGEFDV